MPDDDATSEVRRRRQRLQQVFGDVLPEQTTDDTDHESGRDGSTEGERDEWYRQQVPPHHGG